MSALWLILLAAILIGAQALLFGLNDLRKLSYERHFSKPKGFEGEKIELIEVLSNKKPIPVPWLRAESRIPAELEFEHQVLDESKVSGGLYHRSLFFLSPMCAITRHHSVKLARRGVYEAGSVALTCGDLFAIVKKEAQLEIPCSVMVYPRLLTENELPDPANRWMGDAVVRRWIMPDPFLLNGIRDYLQGDSMKDIHWKASARTGDLRVKVHDYTSDPKVFVMLNIQTSENQWADVSAQNVEAMEQGIRIAATLCLRAIKMGLNAGFASNACLRGKENSGECVFVPSAGGSAQAEKLLETMAQMLLHREKTFPTYLSELKNLTGEDILIISAYDSEELSRAMHQLRAQGNTVNVMKLELGRKAQ